MGKLSFQPWLCFSRCALPSQFRNLTLSGLKILPVNPAFVSDGLPVPNGNLINALIRSTSSQKKKNRFSKRTGSKMRKWVRVVVSISGKGRYYVQFWPITLLVWKPMVSLDVIVALDSVPWGGWDFKITRNDLFSPDLFVNYISLHRPKSNTVLILHV